MAAPAVMLALPLTPAALPAPPALLGLALGVFTPANNTLVMRVIPAASAGTGGGPVNMARGLGTALGVAAVTLLLHISGPPAATATLLTAACTLLTTLPQHNATTRR